MMTMGSLFDGTGSWQLVAKMNNIEPIWSSEIDKNCCIISKKNFPNTTQLGDITKIHGNEIEPVDIITYSFPCTNLSVAGRQEGLKRGKQSSLFFEAIRIIDEMRASTNEEYPKYTIWENVPRVLSINSGDDFRTIIQEITKTNISIPKSRKWGQAGMARSRRCNIYWRQLDSQFWGVPQRRKRIFFITDYTKREDIFKILFECKSLQRSFRKSKTQTQKSSTRIDEDSANSIYDMTHTDSVIRKTNISPTLTARMGTGGNQIPLTTYCISGNIINRKLKNSGNGEGVSENLAYTLTATDRYYRESGHVTYIKDNNTGTLRASGGHCGGGSETLIETDNIIRKLTPVECELLQGLPKNFTEGVSDTQRYKMIGNGIAIPCANFIIRCLL